MGSQTPTRDGNQRTKPCGCAAANDWVGYVWGPPVPRTFGRGVGKWARNLKGGRTESVRRRRKGTRQLATCKSVGDSGLIREQGNTCAQGVISCCDRGKHAPSSSQAKPVSQCELTGPTARMFSPPPTTGPQPPPAGVTNGRFLNPRSAVCRLQRCSSKLVPRGPFWLSARANFDKTRCNFEEPKSAMQGRKRRLGDRVQRGGGKTTLWRGGGRLGLQHKLLARLGAGPGIPRCRMS